MRGRRGPGDRTRMKEVRATSTLPVKEASVFNSEGSLGRGAAPTQRQTALPRQAWGRRGERSLSARFSMPWPRKGSPTRGPVCEVDPGRSHELTVSTGCPPVRRRHAKPAAKQQRHGPTPGAHPVGRLCHQRNKRDGRARSPFQESDRDQGVRPVSRSPTPLKESDPFPGVRPEGSRSLATTPDKPRRPTQCSRAHTHQAHTRRAHRSRTVAAREREFPLPLTALGRRRPLAPLALALHAPQRGAHAPPVRRDRHAPQARQESPHPPKHAKRASTTPPLSTRSVHPSTGP
jgi:hypothetical protein